VLWLSAWSFVSYSLAIGRSNKLQFNVENDAIYQELTESERQAKDALLLQARDLSGCCRSCVFLRLCA
jgi:hypothetical protein